MAINLAPQSELILRRNEIIPIKLPPQAGGTFIDKKERVAKPVLRKNIFFIMLLPAARKEAAVPAFARLPG